MPPTQNDRITNIQCPADYEIPLVDQLHSAFPIDPIYVDATISELQLHEKKATAYAAANSAAPLGNFDRVASFFALYPNLKLSDRRVYLLSLFMKHLDAILANLSAGIALPDFKERALDISVYAKILSTMGGPDGNL